ncbi:MAG: CHASE2 domain-containing protein, partial [Pseudomonadota bacterium]
MNKSYWKNDWFIGLVVTALFLLLLATQALRGLEWRLYDLGLQFTSAKTASADVVVVAIDDASLLELGAWPWPRDVLATATDYISRARPNAIGFALPFDSSQSTRGLEYIKELRGALGTNAHGAGRSVKRILDKAESGLDTDRVLARSLHRAGPVVLAIPYRTDKGGVQHDAEPLGEEVSARLLVEVANGRVNDTGGLLRQFLPEPVTGASAVYPPIANLARASNAVGHMRWAAEGDVNARVEPLVVRFGDQYLPSLALALAALNKGLRLKDVEVAIGKGVRLAGAPIATDRRLNIYPYFYAGRDGNPAFPVYSIGDVLAKNVNARAFRDKAVIIGVTASQLAIPVDTPVGKMAPAVVTAHALSSLLNDDLYRFSEWGVWVEGLVLLMVGAYLMLVLPRFGIGTGMALSALLLVALLNVYFILMISRATWLPLVAPMLALLVGHVVLAAKHMWEARFGRVQLELCEANRLLGQSFHAQGQLDNAFDRYRKCPADDAVLDQLYHLALDYERKRQFNKAEAVLLYLRGENETFRDVRERLARNKELAHAHAFGGAAASNPNSTLVLHTTGIQKPMLGRYQIEKELGRGAMGMVYLGQDPKIGRTVAIKTMSLSQEFEGSKLEDVRQRFFREAETAGRLNHPNIVTIYDVGEDQELAYIAMVYLKGENLLAYCQHDSLLNAAEVFDMTIKVAEALEYAHGQSVVHRDIKPANILYDKPSGTLKVTDFGVACLTDASKT